MSSCSGTLTPRLPHIYSVNLLRGSDTQIALLDRIAGTAGASARFGADLQALREVEAQLAAIDALGDEDERNAMQAMVDEVPNPTSARTAFISTRRACLAHTVKLNSQP